MKKKLHELYQNLSLRSILWASFTLTAALTTIFIGVFFYTGFSKIIQDTQQEETQSLIEQVNNSLSSHLRSMMKVSDSLYYSVIKNIQFTDESASKEFQLLYDTNKEFIESIALFSAEAELIESVPAAILKKDIDVTKQKWFSLALEKTENMHFSLPSVQNLFLDTTEQYSWVLSLSREVQITMGKETGRGVLLIDMRYSGIEQIFSNISLGNGGYIYLIDRSGDIIYHPMQQLISSGIYMENNVQASHYVDGNHTETFQKNQRVINVKTVGYTGWKIIGVTPENNLGLNSFKSTLFFIFIILFLIEILFLLNFYISSKVSNPIIELEKAVQILAAGELGTKVKVDGSNEIKHLGQSIQKMADQMKTLMEDIITEHEAKRKSELDVLQSQINPHFLYNTLDIIVWMVENERKSEAVKVVTALARFFRISLSKGKTVILLEDEIEHARNYLMIQEMRFKNRFTYTITIEEAVKQMVSIKLIIQPLVENAIYHGMQYMDEDGEINISAYQKEGDLYIEIKDNGPGMTEEQVENLLVGIIEPNKKGSGIGVKNVRERIKIYFGESYGLFIVSEPDEGTTITIHMPAILYREWKGTGI